MNAIDTSRRVGLIELPELAELLTRYGITAVTGPDFKSAVAAIKTESAKRAIPIIVADNPTPGLRSWVNRIQQSAPIKVAVVRNLQSPVIDAGSAAEILTPASINDILSTVGLPTLDGPDGLRTFPESVVEAGGGFELPDFDFDDLEDDDLAAAVPVQISAPEPVYEPAPATTPVVPVANEWDSPPVSTTHLSRRALRAQQAPAEDDIFDPEPTPVEQPAPLVDDWDTQVNQPAAPAVENKPWNEPVIPAPQHDWDVPSFDSVIAPETLEATSAKPWNEAIVEPAPVPHEPALRAVPRPAPDPQPASTPEWDMPVNSDWNSFDDAPPVMSTQSWNNAQVATEIVEDMSGLFDDFEASKLRGTGRSAAGLGSLVVCYAGKGGVGKTTCSIQLAHLASQAGLRVVLIDGNAGQGDIMTYLRINRNTTPTIVDSALGNIKDGFVTPDRINADRGDQFTKINFAFVGAPPPDIYDHRIVTDTVYSRVIEYARRNADLVILDTQILEAGDRNSVVANVIVPALVHDGWGLGIADMSNPGVNNLNGRLRALINEGVPTDRLFTFLNRVTEKQFPASTKADRFFHGRSDYLGVVKADEAIGADMNSGVINTSNAELTQVLSKVLLKVTGNDYFRARAENVSATESKPGVFSRMFGRKKSAA